MAFEADLEKVASILRARGKVSLRAAAMELGADDVYVRALRDELVDVLGVAREEGGVLILQDAAAAAPRGDAADTREHKAERRQLTFLFCDVVGSTPLATRLDRRRARRVGGARHGGCRPGAQPLIGPREARGQDRRALGPGRRR